jgi:hypothetical protein
LNIVEAHLLLVDVLMDIVIFDIDMLYPGVERRVFGKDDASAVIAIEMGWAFLFEVEAEKQCS